MQKRHQKKKVLIIGKIPPPLGGISIHVKRLLFQLESSNFSFDFYDLKNFGRGSFISRIRQADLAHLHSARPSLRFVFSILCFLLGTKSLNTIHGNLGRYGLVKNLLDLLAVMFSDVPILLNKMSLEKALQYNKNSKLITSFIPPSVVKEVQEMNNFGLSSNFDLIFCTNASEVKYDQENNDVYGILELIDFFSSHPNYGLVISDSSSEYNNLIKLKEILVPSNILIIPIQHDFNYIIKKSDCLIRYTNTDGDSLSIKEAFYHGKEVIATDCVDRPNNCILVKRGDFEQLSKAMKIISGGNNKSLNNNENGANQLLQLYNEILN